MGITEYLHLLLPSFPQLQKETLAWYHIVFSESRCVNIRGGLGLNVPRQSQWSDYDCVQPPNKAC